jgi:S-adenosylmethionine:tRNA ribosyltransferase-isomerase
MIAAAWPRERGAERVLVARSLRPGGRGPLPPGSDPREGLEVVEASPVDLPAHLRPGDLLVLNDAATLPASLRAETPPGLEVRLAGEAAPPGATEGAAQGPAPLGPRWEAVLFGAGDWRVPTERRVAPPRLGPGDRISFGPGLAAQVDAVSPRSPRLVTLTFDRAGVDLVEALYAQGRPVQYSYLAGDLPLAAVQTPYAARPWAVEPPSAGRALGGDVLQALRARGVTLASLTHAAGLSATGDEALDAALPFPERYDLPQATVDAVARARARGGRVIAVGTTVVRALEGCASTHGALRAGAGVTDLVLGPDSRLQVVDGLLTGVHEPGASHHELLRAFLDDASLAAVLRRAAEGRYLLHEFGDGVLILPAERSPAPSPRLNPSAA